MVAGPVVAGPVVAVLAVAVVAVAVLAVAGPGRPHGPARFPSGTAGSSSPPGWLAGPGFAGWLAGPGFAGWLAGPGFAGWPPPLRRPASSVPPGQSRFPLPPPGRTAR